MTITGLSWVGRVVAMVGGILTPVFVLLQHARPAPNGDSVTLLAAVVFMVGVGVKFGCDFAHWALHRFLWVPYIFDSDDE